jgi:hypothetical protein
MSKKETALKKHSLHIAVLIALGAASSAAYAAVTASNGNFTMLDNTGAAVGGTNDVIFTWNGTLNTDPATAVSNATITSAGPTPFFGLVWTAYDVKVYGPGNYTLSTVDTLGSIDCPYVGLTCVSGGNYNVSVPSGAIMAHMKFAWGATQGIDVVNVWKPGDWTVLNGSNPIYTGSGGTYTGPVYGLTSVDWDGDGKTGAGMIDGPFQGYNANFNIPAASSTSNNNFTMLDNTGAAVGGTNDVIFTWNGTLNTDPATAVSNATITSAGPTPFFGLVWTAYDVKVYGPGNYTLSTVDTLGSIDCPYVGLTCVSGGNYNVSVPSGAIMAHMKFAWGATQGIDVVNVWKPGDWTVLNGSNPIYTGSGGTYTGPVYGLTSVDWDGDGKTGAGMIDGPFQGYNANFNVNPGGAVTPTCPPSCPPPETQLTATSPNMPGCSISSTPVNTTERADWWLVAGFLAWLGIIRARLKRQTKS